MNFSSDSDLNLDERHLYSQCVERILKSAWFKLNIYERYLLLILPLLVDDYGCMEYEPRIIRNAVFAEAGVSLSKVVGYLYKLQKCGIIEVHKTNCGKRILYAKHLLGILPQTTTEKPSLPLPPNVDWFMQNTGHFKIVHSR